MAQKNLPLLGFALLSIVGGALMFVSMNPRMTEARPVALVFLLAGGIGQVVMRKKTAPPPQK